MLTAALTLIRADGTNLFFSISRGRIVESLRAADGSLATVAGRLDDESRRGVSDLTSECEAGVNKQGGNVGKPEFEESAESSIVDPRHDGGGWGAVVRKIDRDANRFKQIVRGKIKSDLRKYITHGELIGKIGRRVRVDSLAADRDPRVSLRDQEPGRRGAGAGRRRDADRPLRATARRARVPARRPASTSSRSS